MSTESNRHLGNRVARFLGCSKEHARLYVGAVFFAMRDALMAGNEIKIRYVGRFAFHRRVGRQMPGHKMGDKVIPPHYQPPTVTVKFITAPWFTKRLSGRTPKNATDPAPRFSTLKARQKAKT